MSTSGALNTALSTGSRSRPQARKKLNDDAAYFGPAGGGVKRQAQEKADGEPRMKRKRVDAATSSSAAAVQSTAAGKKNDKSGDSDDKTYVIDFATLPTAALHRYLVQYDLVPNIYPSPLCAEDPPPPGSLLHPGRLGSRNASPPPPSPATTTPANRPRREPKDHASRRRSSRLLEDDLLAHGRVPVLADVGEVHVALAVIAQRHFREHGVKEVDTLASFMYALSKSKVQ